MSTEADHLCIIFRIGGIGFMMPVADLMAIRDPDDLSIDRSSNVFASSQVGSLQFQDLDVPVFGLSEMLCLASAEDGPEKRYLIFAGTECPWAIAVDRVEGVFKGAEFDCRELTSGLFEAGNAPYQAVAVYNGEPLVSFVPGMLEQRLFGADYAAGPV